ncbi:6-phosphofructokinase 1 [Haloferula luteola]|uniref:ATP-dependent 6-phosphofructokinase n=1 Tax=Haloferula luteola TaxID=595692 RepID=A0A840VEY2_9BACT|nr:ATP-dependent 6-phosphofructokinase [Haloferula luteola]MBB5352389.1 6-phosphofructokinase 1 [Haloferula luteola]
MSHSTISLEELVITNLGEKKFPSPGWQRNFSADGTGWHTDGDRILLCDHTAELEASLAKGEPLPSIELAGPRKEIFFNPTQTCVAIVTCGGLCPGLNDVIRTIVMQSYYAYGVRRILGIQYGYEGLDPAYGHRPLELTPEMVMNLPYFGGTFLGSSRGRKDTKVMVNRLEALGVNILFVIGGDGSQRGATDLFEECQLRGNGISIIGVPKTIDNDLMFMDRSFGYQTAFAAACHAVTGAHAEARGARNGIGLVKLMGRDSGFIACSAALATGEVNFVLIPEVDFDLEGEQGLLAALDRRLEQRGHAVIVVAEGAGQDLVPASQARLDASGNKLHEDIGVFLRDRINGYFKSQDKEVTLKYIDPSYTIRSVPAAPEDRVFCLNLARHAVHAGMAGKTGMVVARWHQRFVHLPMKVVTRGRRKVDPHGDLWRSVVEATGQPAVMKG